MNRTQHRQLAQSRAAERDRQEADELARALRLSRAAERELVDVERELSDALAALEEARQLYSPLAVWSRVVNRRVGDTHINLSYSPF